MSDSRKNSLLIIEDSALMVTSLTRILEPEYTVYAAYDGYEGIKAAEEKMPDLIILDIIMPGIDGYEVIKRLKNNDATKMIPIIFMTSLDDVKNEEQGLALGAEDYIRKPFNDTIVKLRVRTQMRIRSYIREIDQFTEKARLQSELEKALRKANEASEASKAKTAFLARMSHEIRTPMNAIIGMTELALRDDSIDSIKEHIITVKQAASNLLAIINDILDFSKIESGKLEIIPRDYSVAALLDDVVSIIRMKLVDSRVRFSVKVDKDIPRILHGDETKIRQALLNLLSNAVKYTDEGYVSFGVYGKLIEDKAGGSGGTIHLTFEVKDTGIGIKKEDISSLFGDFTQFDLDRHRGIEGIGLGLAITRSIIDAMGGSIGVESVYGKGSTFTIKLPQKYRNYEALAAVKDQSVKSIVILERREAYVDSFAYMLEDLGVSYTLVKNGEELSDRMENERFNYLFIPLPLYRENEDTIKKLGKGAEIVVLSRFGEAIPDKGLNVLSMPVYCTSIADILNGTYGRFSQDPADIHKIGFTAPGARVLVVDDIRTNLKVAEGLFKPYEFNVDLCDSGAAALDAVKSKTYDLIFMDHKMPGMDGVETTKHIRALGINIPIIALTANVVSGMADMFMQSGFNDTLSKPIDTIMLRDLLEKWIPKDKQERDEL